MYKRAVVATVALASSLFISTLTGSTPAQAQDNGASLTPPMGWSSWSFVRRDPSEAKIKAQAKAMKDSGLVAAGYKYINLDDYYINNPGNNVDEYGRWTISKSKFPSGMKALGDYIHSQGEKFGMYVTPGIPKGAYNKNTPIEGTSFHAKDIVSDTSKTESNYGGWGGVMYFIDYKKNPAAAQAYLNSWANLFASYGVDYIKIDGVHTSDQDDVIAWSKALNQTGRTIHYGLSNTLDINNIKTWQKYANSWRISGDIECYCSTLTHWGMIRSRWPDLAKWAQYSQPGGWNDPDSIEVGNGDHDGLTVAERQSQITLWAISKAPLLLGTDLTNLDKNDLALLKNTEVIDIDQHGVGPATPVSMANGQQVWRSKKNSDGSYTVALFNTGDGTKTVTAKWSDLGFTGKANVRDLWAKKDLGTVTDSISRSVGQHASYLFKVTPGTSAPVQPAQPNPPVTTPPATTPPATNPAGTTHLVSALTGRCADSPGGTTVNGSQLIVWDCNGKTNQQVTYDTAAKSLQVLGKCFDAHDNGVASGTRVEIFDCTGKANQQWNLNSDGSITGVQSGICLDVTGLKDPNGTGIELWTCNGGGNQKWSLKTA